MPKPRLDDDEKLKLRNFRMSDPDWEAFEKHFKARRIPTATGIRFVLIEYMKKNKLIK
jgi:hypothetical protein